MAIYPPDPDGPPQPDEARPDATPDQPPEASASMASPDRDSPEPPHRFVRHDPPPIDYAADHIDGLPTWTQARLAAQPGPWETLRRALWPWGLRGVAESLEVVGLALLMFLLVRSGTGNYIVDGRSMFPTFDDGEMVIVNKLAYRSFDLSWVPWIGSEEWSPLGPGTPLPGDVVVFHNPNDPSRDFIKRVIATPGQIVEIRDGILLVDGLPFLEPYLSEPPVYQFGPEIVGPDQLFVLGDNRNNSYDSHQWGMLDDEFVIGRAELRYWPLSDFGPVGEEQAVPITTGVVGGGVPPSS